MVALTLPDGKVRNYPGPVTGADLAKDIGPGHALIHGMTDDATRRFRRESAGIDLRDDLLELLSVLPALDRLNVGSDEFNVVTLEHPVGV